MLNKLEAMVLASFLGDSLSLGAHWIYDPAFIQKNWGRIESLQDPWSGSFHRTKQAGQFTHYGDQTLVLLQSVAQTEEFDLEDFAARWRDFFANYLGYFDRATLETLSCFSKGFGPKDAGSASNDLAGASRIAPVVLAHYFDEDKMISAARAQTAMTHKDPNVVDSAEFFARCASLVLKGHKPCQALDHAAEAKYNHLPVKEWLSKGKKLVDQDSLKALFMLGLSCHAPEAFPGVVQLICRYEENLPEALIQCVMAGGDSAGRAMLVGLILGAWNGIQDIPAQWLNGLQERKQVESLINTMLVRRNKG
jgi:ADP-ribosylglycohydrolase